MDTAKDYVTLGLKALGIVFTAAAAVKGYNTMDLGQALDAGLYSAAFSVAGAAVGGLSLSALFGLLHSMSGEHTKANMSKGLATSVGLGLGVVIGTIGGAVWGYPDTPAAIEAPAHAAVIEGPRFTPPVA